MHPLRIGTLVYGALLLGGQRIGCWYAHHAVRADDIGAGLHVVAELAERAGYLGGRAELGPAGLGVAMDIAAALLQLGQQLIRQGKKFFFHG